VCGYFNFRQIMQLMEMEYEYIREPTLREMMALNAADEPILMSANKAPMMQERIIALTGIFRLGSILEIHLEKGRPLSRAKEKVWRAVDTLKRMVLRITGTKTAAVRPLTPAGEVAWLKT